MKVALCLSGELRRVDLFYPLIYQSILEPYNPDVFISTWNMPDNIPTTQGRVQRVRDKNEISSIDHVVNLFQPVGLHIQKYSLEIKNHFIQLGNSRYDNLMSMTFHIYQSGMLCAARSLIQGAKYDVIIRHRFDYGVKELNLSSYDLNSVNIPREHNYGGYQDMFAFGNSDVMNKYCHWFVDIENIENQYAKKTGLPTNNNTSHYPWHPETSLHRYLTLTKVPVETVNDLLCVYPWCDEKEIKEAYD